MRIQMSDGVNLHIEEVGAGVPVIFIHEYAGDWRTWEPQIRALSRSHRCITFSARGYLPSDIPTDPNAYSQDRFRTDVVEILDALNIEAAHIVGHSMGAYTAVNVGLYHPERCLSIGALGCGWGSSPAERDKAAATCVDIAEMFRTLAPAQSAARYARFAMRLTFEAKDPRGFAEFERMLAEHDPLGMELTMLNLQLKRPTLWDLEDRLKGLSVPLLVLVGDEDHPCIDGSVFLKRVVPSAGLHIVARAGHTITSEEPAIVNAALAELFSAAETGTWMSHRRSPAAA